MQHTHLLSPGHHSKSETTVLDDSSPLPVGGAGSAVDEEELPAAPSGSKSRREALDSLPLLSHNSISRSLSLNCTRIVKINKKDTALGWSYMCHTN